MDYFFNPETLRQQWATIANAPFFTVPPIVLGGLIVWWFRGTTLKGTIGGLKEQIAALDQRLKLAIEQSTAFATAWVKLRKNSTLISREYSLRDEMLHPQRWMMQL
jgi:hypothetical protein